MAASGFYHQTRAALRGRCFEGAAVLSVCGIAWLALLPAELLARAGLLRAGLPAGLVFTVLPVLRYLLGAVLLIPPLLGALWWLVQTAGGEGNSPCTVLQIYRSRRLRQRGGRLLLTLALTAALAQLPAVCAVCGGVLLVERALAVPRAGLLLFAAAQLFLLAGVACVWRWWLLLGLFPAALLFMNAPLQSPSWLLARSLRLMRGQRNALLLALLREALRPFPFLCTRLGVTAALFVRQLSAYER